MGIGDLLAALERDADDEIRELRAEAEARAAAIEAEAKRDRAARVDDELSRFRRDRQLEAEADIAEARAGARREQLTARAEMLERLRDAVLGRLPALLDRADLVDSLADAALDAAGDRAARIRCSPGLVAAVRRRAPAVPVETTDPIGSGIRVDLEGGRGEVDATLESLLLRAWPELRVAALARLDREDR